MQTKHKLLLSLTIPCLIFLGIEATSCGTSTSTFGEGGIKNDGASDASTGVKFDGPVLHLGDSSLKDAEAPDAPCSGQLCNQSFTDDCAGKNKPFTSISGVVYDPAGHLPLYDIYVYVPGAVPDPIDPGNPACTPCQAPASGSPIIGTLTNEQGQFTLTQLTANDYGVPSGADIPLVIQTGKWRKQITISQVNACSNTVIANPDASVDKLRLPANSSEGDMPLIALTSGCDPAECALLHYGISQSEFVAPNAPLPVAWQKGVTPITGAGHIRFYTGNDNNTGGPASSVDGGNTVANTYAWWQSSTNLLQEDIIFNACECSPFNRGAIAYQAMDTYLNGGGRLFTTHYYYNWFEPSPPATADLFSIANWDLTAPLGNQGLVEQDLVDQTFPKGMAFATWLQDNNITTVLGSIGLGDVRDDVNGVLPANCESDGGTCLATQWIYTTTPIAQLNVGTRYLSANTPVGSPIANQCGKVTFSDVHVSGKSNDTAFPSECVNPDPTGIHVVNEEALEFLFFDLSSCVQNEKAPPIMPQPPQPPR